MEKITKLTGILSPLNEIPEPPKQLYLEGALPPEGTTLLAVVGSRKFSSYGKEACNELIAGLAGKPISIVSGLAIGMDTLAHKAALSAGLHTLAMPGSGLSRSVLHPPSNCNLADEILRRGGCLLSEYDPEMPAGTFTFPRRNRLMAGLAKAVLVVEAGEKSGTRITARLATEYNREVLAVPGSIFSPQSAGANQLLRLGATPITDSNEILVALGFPSSALASGGQASFDFADLTDTQQKIVELLSVEPLPRDEIIQELEVSTSEANTALAALEIKGVITEAMGEVRLT